MAKHKPLVWLPACHRFLETPERGTYSILADRYAAALTDFGLQPVLFPLARVSDIIDLLPLIDGVLLTGSPSNVEATHFGVFALPTDLLDPRRDALTLALVPAALAHGVPLLGVCRGLQEMNVALGGTLHQEVHAQPDLSDHREPADPDLSVQFSPRHEVHLLPDSAFAQWAGGTTVKVNSLHGQGVNRLAPGLAAEAFAPDGLVEGFRVIQAETFAYGVQWHPEWQHHEHPFYQNTLRAFANACEVHKRARGV